MSGLKRNDISLIKDTLNLAVSQANNALNVNILTGGGGGGGGGDVIKGSYNNIINNLTLPANTSLPVEGLAINNEYGNESVISYQDSTFAATSFISIYGSFATTNSGNETTDPTWFYIGVLQPAVIRTNCRQASSVLKLKGLKRIRIRNEGAADVANVLCTLFSG